MRRAYILIVIVVVLIFAAFSISFGWHYAVQKAIQKAVGMSVSPNESANPEKTAGTETMQENSGKKAEIRLLERAAYRKPNGAEIVITIQNAGDYPGSAEIYAELIYKQKSVANNSVIVESILPNHKINVTINITYFEQWNAFNVSLI
ncbi:hypothetical protein KY308_02965 [Candidatus Woesearchaeota archaeon]|nr:hypothetical protein [Candidatus Woesearchaeota archaeon]